MDFKSTKRLYHTPTAKDKFYGHMYKRLEATNIPLQEIDLETDITFFGNEPAHGIELGYDQFFSFTKIFPLYDQRKERENRGFSPDTWKNIHQQEQPPKPVPATTSQWYGRRQPYDLEIKTHGRKNQTGSFYSTRGALQNTGQVKYTEEIVDFRL